MGQTAEASSLLQKALQRNPKDLQASVQRAQLAIRTGDYKNAEADLMAALRREPQMATIHYLLGLLHQQQGDLQIARQEFASAIESEPRMLNARIALVKLMVDRQQAEAAVDYAEQAPGEQHDLLPLIVVRNWALIAAGRLPEAKAAVEKALVARRSPDLLLQQAVLWNYAGQFQRGLNSIEEALKIDPESEDGMALLMATYTAMKHPDDGIRRIRAFAVAHPNSARLQFLLGRQLVALARRDEARSAFRAAWESDRKFLAAPLALAELDLEDGRLDAARESAAAVLKDDAANAKALFELGRVEEQAGRTAGAIGYYRQAVESDPSFAMALNNLAFVMAQQGKDLDGALGYAQRAMTLAPSNEAVADTLGWCYFRKGFYDQAIRYLQPFTGPSAVPVRKFHLAMAYLKKGDGATAGKLLMDLHQHYPDLPELKGVAHE